MLVQLKATVTYLQTPFSCRKTHSKQQDLQYVHVCRWVGMYNLITYEMACTVNALKFWWATFCVNEYCLLKEYIFALLIQFLTFLLACRLLFQSVKEMKGDSKGFECKKSNKKQKATRVVALCVWVCLLHWWYLYMRLNDFDFDQGVLQNLSARLWIEKRLSVDNTHWMAQKFTSAWKWENEPQQRKEYNISLHLMLKGLHAEFPEMDLNHWSTSSSWWSNRLLIVGEKKKIIECVWKCCIMYVWYHFVLLMILANCFLNNRIIY